MRRRPRVPILHPLKIDDPLTALGGVVAFTLPFAVYLYYLCPTIAAGDTTELINCAAVLGIPHAPGYPLFTMLGHAFAWLPVNSVAWRVNLSSTLFSALACLFVYLSLTRLTGRVWAGLTGALGLAFSRFFWHYAEVAEVFPLNNLFVALMTYTLVRFHGSLRQKCTHEPEKKAISSHLPADTRRFFWLFCLFFALALTNHHTIVLLLPASLLFLRHSVPALIRDSKTLAIGLLAFLLGLLPYVYLPLAGMTDPPINWGNPTTLENFVRLVLRMDFGTFRLASVSAEGSRFLQLPIFFAGLHDQFTPLGICLGIIGLLGFKRHKLMNTYLSLSFLFSGVFFVVFANYPTQPPMRLGVLHRFYIMPAVIFTFWIGLGTNHVLSYFEKKQHNQIFRKVTPVFLAGGLLLWQFASNLEEANFRNNYIAEDLAHNVLLCLPEDSIFFVQGDFVSMGIDYFQLILGQRKDIVNLNQEVLTYEWFYEQAKERFPNIVLRGESYDGVNALGVHLIDDNIDQRPVCFRYFKDKSHVEKYRCLKRGLICEMIPKNTSYSLKELEEHMKDLYAKFKKRGWQRIHPEASFERVIKGLYAEPFAWLGYEFSRAGKVEKAAQCYQAALQMNQNHTATLKNLAILYFQKMNRPDDAVELLSRYLTINPNDTDAGRIKQIIKSHRE